MKVSQSSSAGEPPITPPRPQPEGFALAGRSVRLDTRINAVRPDIADIALAGTLFAPHYASPVQHRCAVPHAAMRAKPADDAELVSELLYGEGFAVLDITSGWAWGYGEADHYVGYVRAALLDTLAEPRWRVAVRSTPRLSAKDGPAVDSLSMGALISGAETGAWIDTGAGFVARGDVLPIDHGGGDYVSHAEKMLGAPYLLGGRSVAGIDCSGLVQVAMALTGVAVQRDSDLQEATIGSPLPADAALMRGDLVFFPGHVGIMKDAETLLHANGHAGAVSQEPLAEALARMEPDKVAAMTRRRP